MVISLAVDAAVHCITPPPNRPPVLLIFICLVSTVLILQPKEKLTVEASGAMIGLFSMLMVNEHVAVLFDASRAVQSTVVVPRLKKEPLVGAQLYVTFGQLSVTVGALYVTFLPLHVASASND